MRVSSATDILRQAGIVNPQRVIQLINEAVDHLELDLSGFTVLTEAGTGIYTVTPVIAALAGASHVTALTHDSRFGTAADVIAQTHALEELCGIENRIDIRTNRTPDIFAAADIITNLGFVRPIDAEAIHVMKSTVVIALMCETWEFRPGDVDREACKLRQIPLLGTDEDQIEVFQYSAWLCLRMLMDAGIEGYKSRVMIVSSDKFGQVLYRQLSAMGLSVQLVPDARKLPVTALDALIIADYTRADEIIGLEGDITPENLAAIYPGITLIQFAGHIDAVGLTKHGFTVYPAQSVGAKRMGMTLDTLGPKPVIELHAAGLKVGQALAEARLRQNLPMPQAIAYALEHSPAQDFGD